ncbi:NADPH-dependent oxidoreductase [Arenicella chitinivorans]|uniref:NADPH-dependent oxidoreductase n=1 Tax=Arenicella chitinivorans TaxID=1329800 RepID=A0A918VQQ0_9GAMM|nr:oxygen-insensitive NADPH nitroreductase [Arenicella chitinivorans]GHA16009.1 NADPH-dependent oxidoreductase [Arenicella chitinivorans]
MYISQITELLKQHRSIRRFTDKPIEPALLNDLIASGQAASTSSYIQAVSVIQVSDLELRRQFAELAGGQMYIETAAEFLVFCADLNRNAHRSSLVADEELDFSWTEQFVAAVVDTALFAQNVVVAAEANKLGCCYIGGIRNNPDLVTSLLALPTLVFPVFGLCLGYPDQSPERKPRLPLETVLYRDRYQSAVEHAPEIDTYDTHVREYYVRRSQGKLTMSWSEQMAKQARTQTRDFMQEYLKKQGFVLK